MKFSSGRRRRGATDINLTPLIDIIFQLLLFFVITTTFVQNPGIDVELPKASAEPSTGEQDSVIVAVTAEGRVVHQGQAVSMEELTQRLTEQYKQRQSSVVIVQADTNTPHGKVVEVMDIARRIGFRQLAIATAASE